MTIREFFERPSKAKLTINLAKSEFCHATLTFLGLVVGQGPVIPVEAKQSNVFFNLKLRFSYLRRKEFARQKNLLP